MRLPLFSRKVFDSDVQTRAFSCDLSAKFSQSFFLIGVTMYAIAAVLWSNCVSMSTNVIIRPN